MYLRNCSQKLSQIYSQYLILSPVIIGAYFWQEYMFVFSTHLICLTLMSPVNVFPYFVLTLSLYSNYSQMLVLWLFSVRLSNLMAQMPALSFVLGVIKSATRPERGQNGPLFGHVFLFSFPFLRYWALVSFSPFQRRISPCPPSPSPKRYQRPLIVTLFICAHSEAAKQCVISGLCHVRA